MKYSITISAILIAVSLASLSFAEYRSGYFRVPYPCDKDTVGIDFSELTDSCAPEGGFDSCTILSADLLFPITAAAPESLNAVVGIIDLGEFDSTGLTNLDTVPPSGYLMYMTPELNHIYAIKTTEGHYAAMFFAYQYIGGINRHGFTWAYQSDGTNNLDPTFIKTKHNKLNNNISMCNFRVFASSKVIIFTWPPFHGQARFSLYNSLGQIEGAYMEDGEKGSFVKKTLFPGGIYFVKSNISPNIIRLNTTDY